MYFESNLKAGESVHIEFKYGREYFSVKQVHANKRKILIRKLL